MKKLFEEPILEIITIEVEDIVTASTEDFNNIPDGDK